MTKEELSICNNGDARHSSDWVEYAWPSTRW